MTMESLLFAASVWKVVCLSFFDGRMKCSGKIRPYKRQIHVLTKTLAVYLGGGGVMGEGSQSGCFPLTVKNTSLDEVIYLYQPKGRGQIKRFG